jgi:phenylacetate-coenzyme A ligase PaaK-like adenylate-forming protein
MTAAVATDTLLSPHALQAHALELLERDGWSRERLLEYQRARLRTMIEHAVRRSEYYREALDPDAADAQLSDLPTLPKTLLMDEFDRIATDPRLRRRDLESFLDAADAGALYLDEYRLFSTSGSSGVPGLFVYSQHEFAHWAAVFLRCFLRLGVTGDTRMTGIGAPSALHLSLQIASALMAGREGAPRLAVTMPIPVIVEALAGYRPEVLVGYPTVVAAVAQEQLEGRLEIAPRVVVTGSEVLTEDAARTIEAAWGAEPVDMYASTELGVIAMGSLDRVGMHVCEEGIVEVVDGDGRPVAPGAPGSKVLLTNLVNTVQPLIRYELTDSVTLAEGPDPSGRPFDLIARVDGRSDDVLTLPAAGGGEVRLHPFRLGSPFVRLREVLQYQIVHRERELLVRIVPRGDAGTELSSRVGAAVESVLADAGASIAVSVEVVDAIEREQGHAAKVKLVVSEVGPPA